MTRVTGFHEVAVRQEMWPPATAFLSPDEEASAWLGVLEHKQFSAEEERILLGDGVISKAGVHVSAATALNVAAVFCCCRVISEDIAKMSRRIKRQTFDAHGRERNAPAPHHPLAKIISRKPNAWMTAFEFWEWMVFMAALYGSSEAYVTRDDRGHVQELLPLMPGCVSPMIDERWNVSYQLTGYGVSRALAPGEVLRLNGPMRSEIDSFSPYCLAREAIGLSAAIEHAQARFHANDLRPSAILGIEGLTTAGDNAKSPEVIARIRDDWRKAYGPGGEGGVAILDKKFTFEALTATSADSQTIENRKFQIEEVCRFFRVNPQKVMQPTQAQGYGSVEQFNISHVSDTLHPWVERIEQAIDRDLLSPEDSEDGYYAYLNMNALARGTLGDRVSAYEKAVKIFLTPNEIRAMEDMDPLDDPAADRVQFLANNTGLAPAPQPASERPEPPRKPLEEVGRQIEKLRRAWATTGSGV